MAVLTVIDSWDPPAGAFPFGITWDGTHLWLSAEKDGPDRIYKLTTAGVVVDSFEAPGNLTKGGLAWDGENLWSATWEPEIYKVDTGGTILSQFDPGYNTPRGLTWDGTHLWNIEGATQDVMHKFQTDGTDVDSWNTNQRYGLTWSGTYLWGNDEALLYVYQRDGTFVPPTFAWPLGFGHDITWDGTYIWVAASADDWKIRKLAWITAAKDVIAMSEGPTGFPWYAWLEGNDIKINYFTSETGLTVGTAITVDSSGDFDSVAGVEFTGGIIRVIVRKESDGKPYCFQSEDFGANWTGPTDVS